MSSPPMKWPIGNGKVSGSKLKLMGSSFLRLCQSLAPAYEQLAPYAGARADESCVSAGANSDFCCGSQQLLSHRHVDLANGLDRLPSAHEAWLHHKAVAGPEDDRFAVIGGDFDDTREDVAEFEGLALD